MLSVRVVLGRDFDAVQGMCEIVHDVGLIIPGGGIQPRVPQEVDGAKLTAAMGLVELAYGEELPGKIVVAGSFRPNDIVEITEYPWQPCSRGAIKDLKGSERGAVVI